MKKIIILLIVMIWTAASFSIAAENPPQNGIHKTFYKSGALQSEENYKNGKRHGISTVYLPDGKVKHKLRFKNGKFIEKFWDEEKPDLGPFSFAYSPIFWVITVGILGAIYFLFSKIAFKDRPF